MFGFVGRRAGRSKSDSAAAVAAAAAARRTAAPATATAGGRTIQPPDYGLPPAAELRTDAFIDLPELDAALAAARSGRWQPAADLFAAHAGHAELRYLFTTKFASIAAEEEGWLSAWRAARPQDPAALAVHGRSYVDLAWQIRGSAPAEDVSREQWDGFFRVLGEAPALCRAAAALDSADPVPWIVQLGAAMGLQWPHDEFRALWSEVTSRSPYNVKAHLAAMSYWRPRWHGSLELLEEFVEDSIANAPRGSLLTLLRLDMLNSELLPADPTERRAYWQNDRVRAAVDDALADLAAANPRHPHLHTLRGWLAYFQTLGGRYAEAVEQFKLLGPWIGTEPWIYAMDGKSLFLTNRTNAVLGWEDAGRPALPDGRSPLDVAPPAGR